MKIYDFLGLFLLIASRILEILYLIAFEGVISIIQPFTNVLNCCTQKRLNTQREQKILITLRIQRPLSIQLPRKCVRSPEKYKITDEEPLFGPNAR